MGSRDLVPLPVTAHKSGFGRVGLAVLGLVLLAPAIYLAASHWPAPEPTIAAAAPEPLPMAEAAPVPLPVSRPQSTWAPLQPKQAKRDVPVLPPPSEKTEAMPLPPPRGPVPAEGWLLEGDASQPLTTGSIDRRLVTYPNTDIDGRDYRVLKNTGLAECRTSCQSDGRCRAFTFNTWEKVCFLKASADVRRIEPRGVSGVLATEAVRSAKRPPTIQTVRSRRFPGQPYKVLRRGNFDACAGQCMAEPSCLGFNYDKADRSCALIATLDRSVPSRSTDAGMKWQAPIVEVSAMRRRGPSPRSDLPPEAAAIFEAVFGQIMR